MKKNLKTAMLCIGLLIRILRCCNSNIFYFNTLQYFDFCKGSRMCIYCICVTTVHFIGVHQCICVLLSSSASFFSNLFRLDLRYEVERFFQSDSNYCLRQTVKWVDEKCNPWNCSLYDTALGSVIREGFCPLMSVRSCDCVLIGTTLLVVCCCSLCNFLLAFCSYACASSFRTVCLSLGQVWDRTGY